MGRSLLNYDDCMMHEVSRFGEVVKTRSCGLFDKMFTHEFRSSAGLDIG